MARIPLLTQSDLPEEYRYLLSEDAMGEINLLCAMANNPAVLQSYMRYGSTLWSDGGLNSVDLERCILAVARALDARYEWHQHVPIAREQGVDDEEILAISRGEFDQFDERTAALLGYVRDVALGEIDDESFDSLGVHVTDESVIGATILATHYLATARFLTALAIPLETEFVGWELEGET
ncbi:carboxymuconolactone decarboxylase family protein [Haladaptatus halobius]|uniref:carboxymuconolactone decarboxylase family protein n=1 Tax=Haladaptatus halobius TaxID=2884875 RepID=UPI001D09F64C|nr:carboxymuconolactone decarboxylase family protein [Haladaptatus halobius]